MIKPIGLLSIWLLLLALVGCATLPENVDRPSSKAFSDTGDTAIGSAIAKETSDHPGQSGFLLLENGLDAFVARAVLARFAERSIDVQYYLYHDDLVGRLFTDQLVQAANRGVRVRLLVDDMDLRGRDLGLAVLDAHPDIEVRIFNPFSRNVGRTSQFITRLGSVTRRMHNKSFTVDNQATILGGRNIGNEYFEADPNLAFADLDVMGIGPVAREVSASFDLYWNSELAYPAGVLLGKPPTPEEISQKLQKLQHFVADQADSEYLRALRNSSLAKKIQNNQVAFRWGPGRRCLRSAGKDPAGFRPDPVAPVLAAQALSGCHRTGNNPLFTLFRARQGGNEIPDRPGRTGDASAHFNQLPGLQ